MLKNVYLSHVMAFIFSTVPLLGAPLSLAEAPGATAAAVPPQKGAAD
ncbi:MAG: hypothetical protein HKO62_10225 [Gammaproteobacteria bacterium]|nr:hypothetical protein [Gammaproteobacteria bacterium]NNM01115.1 hypothetical protein [Gammaproteobacteria bacterium]